MKKNSKQKINNWHTSINNFIDDYGKLPKKPFVIPPVIEFILLMKLTLRRFTYF